MKKNTKRKCFSRLFVLGSLTIALFLIVNAGFNLVYPDTAVAASKTKWQRMLEQNNVSSSLWSKYLPKVTRSEYNKVKKNLSIGVSAQGVSKWQRMLEQNGVDRLLWQKYLPKVTRKEYNKVKKMMGSNNSSNNNSPAAAAPSLGPEISVGLWYFGKSDVFKLTANKTYNIKNKDGSVIAQVAGNTETKVTYDDNGKLKISGSVDASADDNIMFDAADGDDSSVVFDVNKPGDSYDNFRGKVEVNYYHGKDIYNGNDSSVTQLWVINKLPLEQYVWGMGETTGTGPEDHVRVMATIFRTYGFWYIENATKYKPLGFKIRSDSNSQIYGGYDWEKDHSNIKKAAEATRGQLVMYKGKAALTPYCSYTDGKTRKYPDDDYPYLKSVKDHEEGIKKGLKPGDGGNHMWGVSAHGALGYAKDGKSWTWILKHYYSGVDIGGAY